MNLVPPAVQTVLILDDELAVTEGLSAGLQRPGRDVVSCNDVESAEIALEALNPTHVVADVHISGPFGFEGLDFIRYAKRRLPETRTILITGDAPEALQLEASERGAVAFLKKPFDVEELEALIDLMTTVPLSKESGGSIIRMPLFDEIVSGVDLYTVFQPIVGLGEQWTPFAHAAQTRLRTDSPFSNVDRLFKYAERKQRVAELDRAFIHAAVEAALPLLESQLLFVNVHPSLFTDGRTLSNLFIQYAERDIRVDKVILEVNEQQALDSGEEVFANFETLRELGVRFAFAEVGVAYSHLPLINRIRPKFLKISPVLGASMEKDLTKVRIVTNVTALARDFGCEMILEGIESAATADAAAKLGIQYGQGSLFGKPVPASAFKRGSAGVPGPA
jgi:EAL domain-containing protein (putative c-di-GMP-specific phosphodiesterase class I)